MAKLVSPILLPSDPLAWICPTCNAAPHRACKTASGADLELVHVARIKAAAKMDSEAKERQGKHTFEDRLPVQFPESMSGYEKESQAADAKLAAARKPKRKLR